MFNSHITLKYNKAIQIACSIYLSIFINLFNESQNLFLNSVSILSLFLAYTLSKQCKLYYVFLTSLTFLLILYYPISIYFDITKQGVFLSTLETNKSEAFEFFLTITPHDYLIILFSIFVLYIHSQTKNIFSTRNKLFIYFLLILSSYIYSINDKISLNLFKLYDLYKNYHHELNRIKQAKNKSDSWNIIEKKEKKKTIVIIIGESVTRKYLSLYGSQYKTTPFLNKVNGDFFVNYISPAGFTALSIPRTLALNHNNIVHYENNAVALAKKAGYKTYWISNQGFIGEHDTAISMLASKSDFISYKTNKDYLSNKSDDLDMLGIFNNIAKNHEKKVVFIHMLGSHPDFCSRLFNYNVHFSTIYGKNFNCYLSTIHKMDYFISKIYKILYKSNDNFSLIYFSDHGLKNSSNKSDKIHLIHDDTHQDNFNVPFFIIRNSDQQHKLIDKKISGIDFLHFFSKEMGVTTTNLSNKVDTQRKVLSEGNLIFYSNLASKENVHAVAE